VDQLVAYDAIKQPLPFAAAERSPSFDADEWRERRPKTQRDFWKDRRDSTRAWLADPLRDGPLPAALILSRAKKDDIPERGLRRAKRRMSIIAYKRGGRDGRQGARWFWITPRKDPAADITP
jgi:hypothetical protein